MRHRSNHHCQLVNYVIKLLHRLPKLVRRFCQIRRLVEKATPKMVWRDALLFFKRSGRGIVTIITIVTAAFLSRFWELQQYQCSQI